MKSIESYMFYGDNAEVFRPLIGFKIVDIQFTHTNEENDDVVILKCVNEHKRGNRYSFSGICSIRYRTVCSQ